MTADREEHFSSLFAAINEVDRLTQQVIIDDLSSMIPSLHENQEKAAEALRNAVAELEAPEERLAELDRFIKAAERKCTGYEAELASGDPEARAMTRVRLEEWQGELAALREKKAQAHEEMAPLITGREKAKADLRIAGEMLEGLALNMADPYRGIVAQATWSYNTFRVETGRLVPLLWAHDDTSPEWSRALEFCLELCERAGVRTDGSAGMRRLPSNAEALANTLAELDKTGPELHPSGQEAVAQYDVIGENIRLSRERQLIEDYRYPMPPREVVPDYKQVPVRVRDII